MDENQNKCSCGSGKDKYPIYDGYRIFLCYVCEDCEENKLGTYRPDIMERYETDEQIEDDY
jgi:hypothetical protein